MIIEKIRYIPNATLKKLNKKAVKAGAKSLTDDAPVLHDGSNVPIFRAIPGLNGAGWINCEIPATADCEIHVFLDIKSEDFEKLPYHEAVKQEVS